MTTSDEFTNIWATYFISYNTNNVAQDPRTIINRELKNPLSDCLWALGSALMEETTALLD